MRDDDLFRTLSGCKFYQNYLHPQGSDESLPANESRSAPPPARRWIDQVCRKYSMMIGWLLLGTILLIVVPLWLVNPSYGKACLLGAPPMVVGALSWMAGAWWAWDKDQRVLMAVTVGTVPARLFLGLAWVWVVMTLREVPLIPFVFSMMWYWMLFTVPEFVMLVELSQKKASPEAQERSVWDDDPNDARRRADPLEPRPRPPVAAPRGETPPRRRLP